MVLLNLKVRKKPKLKLVLLKPHPNVGPLLNKAPNLVVKKAPDLKARHLLARKEANRRLLQNLLQPSRLLLLNLLNKRRLRKMQFLLNHRPNQHRHLNRFKVKMKSGSCSCSLKVFFLVEIRFCFRNTGSSICTAVY